MDSKTKELIRYGNKYNLPDGFIYGYDNTVPDDTGTIALLSDIPSPPGLNYREFVAWNRKMSINKIYGKVE